MGSGCDTFGRAVVSDRSADRMQSSVNFTSYYKDRNNEITQELPFIKRVWFAQPKIKGRLGILMER